MPLKSQLMKNLFILLFLVIICILFSCQKGNSNKPASTTSNIPSSIIYQDLDTTTGNYITTQTFYLFPDSAGIYFDSIQGNFINSTDFTSIIFNHTLFNSKKYLIFDVTSKILDSNLVSILKFNSQNSIISVHDFYSLIYDGENYIGGNQNNDFGYTNSVLSSIGIHEPYSAAESDMSYNFDVKSHNSDSMKIVSGRNHDQIELDRLLKYTVYFDNKLNNTNLIQLSGYLYDYFLPIGNSTSNTYGFIRNFPFPNLNMKLAKSVYITEYLGTVIYEKYADFTYEFDSENKVTKATIKTYYIDYSGVIYPNYITTKRILFTY